MNLLNVPSVSSPFVPFGNGSVHTLSVTAGHMAFP